MAGFFDSFGGQWESEKAALAVKKEEKAALAAKREEKGKPANRIGFWEVVGGIIGAIFCVFIFLWWVLKAVWWFLTRKWFWKAAAIVGGGYFGWQLIRYLVFQLTFGQLFLPG